jgi:2-dehydro-3-deoxyphosphooctonate aldolase (KDO 8-P synthase)
LPTNIKKGQFVSPEACKFIADKFRSGKGKDVMICERGFSFGYNDLVVDATCIPRIQKAADCPVVLDCTHSLQRPNTSAGVTGSLDRDLAETLAKFGVATGADGLFMEVHPQPELSPSDSANIMPLAKLAGVIEQCMRIHNALNL